MDGYIQIGTIVASFGLNGEMVVQHEIGTSFTKDNLSPLYIELNKNNFIPYFISSVRKKSDTEAFLKLEDIDSKEATRIFFKKKICVSRKQFHSIIQPESNLYYLGFTVIDKKELELGTISEIVQLPGQLIGKIMDGENELLIPLTERIIDRIAEKEKIIYVSLPEGLLDIYRP